MFHLRFRPFLSLTLACALSLAAQGAFAASSVVGVIEFMTGDVTLTRAGSVVKNLDIGFSVESFDQLKTGKDGEVVIALDKATGYSGTLKVKPKSVFSVKTEALKGAPATEADLISGSVAIKETALKAQKLSSGSPSLRVRTTSTVMGVRGTQFDVTLSVNDSVLVGCSEGAVSCQSEEGDALEAVPGQTVVRGAGERLKRVPVAVTDLETFRKTWIADEIQVFKADPQRAIEQYSKQYRRLKSEFNKAFEPMAKDDALAAWASEYKRGSKPGRANDIAVMKQKSALSPKIMAVRRSLFLLERVYYRLDDVREQLGSSVFSAKLSTGGSVSDFYKEMDADKAGFEKKTAAYRFALRLYAERNEGRDLSSMMDGDDSGDFFDDTSSFFD